MLLRSFKGNYKELLHLCEHELEQSGYKERNFRKN